MTSNLYLVAGDDSYQIEIDTDHETILHIWRYRGNNTVRPTIIAWEDLDHDILRQIDRKVLQNHGFTILE